MSVGSSVVSITVASTGELLVSGVMTCRNSVAVTVYGMSAVPVLIVYRDGTAVAQCSSFAQSGSNYVGTMDLDTEELVEAFEDVSAGELIRLDFVLYNTTTNAAQGIAMVGVRKDEASYYEASEHTGVIAITAGAGLYFEVIDGINYFVLKDSAGVIYARFPAPGATPND